MAYDINLSLLTKTAADRIAELEAENEKLRAERIDMLLHPEKYFSCYRDLKVVAAENAALKAERDEYWDDAAALAYDRDRLEAALGEIEYIVNCKAYSTAHGSVISGICEKALRGGED